MNMLEKVARAMVLATHKASYKTDKQRRAYYEATETTEQGFVDSAWRGRLLELNAALDSMLEPELDVIVAGCDRIAQKQGLWSNTELILANWQAMIAAIKAGK